MIECTCRVYLTSFQLSRETVILCCHEFFSGQEPSDSVVDGMMSEAPGPLNFTMFLTLFGEKLTGKLYHNLYSNYCCPSAPCTLPPTLPFKEKSSLSAACWQRNVMLCVAPFRN